jgi:hypothetical protein
MLKRNLPERFRYSSSTYREPKRKLLRGSRSCSRLHAPLVTKQNVISNCASAPRRLQLRIGAVGSRARQRAIVAQTITSPCLVGQLFTRGSAHDRNLGGCESLQFLKEVRFRHHGIFRRWRRGPRLVQRPSPRRMRRLYPNLLHFHPRMSSPLSATGNRTSAIRQEVIQVHADARFAGFNRARPQTC